MSALGERDYLGKVRFGLESGRKIMISGAGPKMLHGWRRIISTII